MMDHMQATYCQKRHDPAGDDKEDVSHRDELAMMVKISKAECENLLPVKSDFRQDKGLNVLKIFISCKQKAVVMFSVFNRWIIPLLIITICSGHCNAQKIIIERSKLRPPPWAFGWEKDYIIGTGEGSTFEEARSMAERNVIIGVARSIVMVPEISSSLQFKNLTLSNDVTTTVNFEQSYKEYIYPGVLNEIEFNNIYDFYWEKEILKRKKTTHWVRYCIKFSFDSHKLQRCIRNWKMQDEKIINRLSRINNVQSYESLNEVLKDFNELEQLEESCLGNNKQEARCGKTNLSLLLQSLRLNVISHDPGELIYIIKSGNITLSTTLMPNITSNCARNYSFSNTDTLNIIKYIYDDCPIAVDNQITITYQLPGIILRESFSFNNTTEGLDIKVSGPMLVKEYQRYQYWITKANFQIPFIAAYDAPIIIESIEFTPAPVINNKNGKSQNPYKSILVNHLNQEFSGKGTHIINFSIDCLLGKESHSSSRQKLIISGSITCRNKYTGERRIFEFNELEWKTNW